MPETVRSPETVTRTRLCPLYHVFLHNDDVNSMDHVVIALMKIFGGSGLNGSEAVKIMFEAHNEGCAIVRTEPMEHAELHRDQLQSFSLASTIEPA